MSIQLQLLFRFSNKSYFGRLSQVLLGDYNDLNMYYRHFVNIALRREPVDVTMDLISNLVPHIWTPTHRFYQDLMKEIMFQSKYQYLPKVWMDLQVSEFCSIKTEGKFEFMTFFGEAIFQVGLLHYKG
jgi:hypothetical protein